MPYGIKFNIKNPAKKSKRSAADILAESAELKKTAAPKVKTAKAKKPAKPSKRNPAKKGRKKCTQSR